MYTLNRAVLEIVCPYYNGMSKACCDKRDIQIIDNDFKWLLMAACQLAKFFHDLPEMTTVIYSVEEKENFENGTKFGTTAIFTVNLVM